MKKKRRNNNWKILMLNRLEVNIGKDKDFSSWWIQWENFRFPFCVSFTIWFLESELFFSSVIAELRHCWWLWYSQHRERISYLIIIFLNRERKCEMDPSTFYIFIFVCTPHTISRKLTLPNNSNVSHCEVDQLWKENRTLSRSLLGHLIIIQLSFIQVKTILDDICVKEMLCELLNSLLAWILFSYNGNESLATNLEIYTIFKKRKRWKKKRTQQDSRIFRRMSSLPCMLYICCLLKTFLLTLHCDFPSPPSAFFAAAFAAMDAANAAASLKVINNNNGMDENANRISHMTFSHHSWPYSSVFNQSLELLQVQGKYLPFFTLLRC